MAADLKTMRFFRSYLAATNISQLLATYYFLLFFVYLAAYILLSFMFKL